MREKAGSEKRTKTMKGKGGARKQKETKKMVIGLLNARSAQMKSMAAMIIR